MTVCMYRDIHTLQPYIKLHFVFKNIVCKLFHSTSFSSNAQTYELMETTDRSGGRGVAFLSFRMSPNLLASISPINCKSRLIRLI